LSKDEFCTRYTAPYYTRTKCALAFQAPKIINIQ
jgi:hypothetical protein